MRMKTAVYQVPAPTVEPAALCLVETNRQRATHVPVLLAIQVLAASMTQMNVPPHPLYARTKEDVSTPPAPTSKDLDLQSDH